MHPSEDVRLKYLAEEENTPHSSAASSVQVCECYHKTKRLSKHPTERHEIKKKAKK
jgi:hypothetical protein